MDRSKRVLALVAALLAALAAVTGATAGQAPLSSRLAAALAVPNVDRSDMGAVAVDLASGAVVYALNPDRPLAPASNEKLAVSYAALVRLGPAYRFRTVVLGDGARDGAVWRGNLYLQGHGDPTLRTFDLKRLAAQLRQAGIRRVTGDVLADESAFDARRDAPGWKPSFVGDESPRLSALVVNRARYRGRPTADPAGAAAAVFARVLPERGIAVDGRSGWGRAPGDAFPLAQIVSEPLVDVLRAMDRDSDNFTAELLLKALGEAVGGGGTTKAGAEVVVDALADAGVPLAGVRIVDGSGLSRLDRLTPRAIAAILTTAWADDELRDPLWRALAVAGVSGTLEDRLDRRPTFGAVHAKTGTTTLASALSGFVGDRFAFAVVQNGHPVDTEWARRAQDRFATALADS